jgi:peptide/nickel transport system permease protein
MNPRKPGIPRRLRNWIFIWVPTTWLVLTLITFPKDRPIATGIKHVLGGFIAPTVGNFPAWTILFVALPLAVLGIVGIIRNAKKRRFNSALVVLGAVFAAWGYVAGDPAHFALTNRHGGLGWFFQIIVVLAAGACMWLWAVDGPERAQLMVWNTHQIWKLYRSNWQGTAGLWIICIFMAIALLAPFLADHNKLLITEGVGPNNHPPAATYYRWMGTDDAGQSVLAEFIWSTRISLVVGLIATFISTILGAGIGIVAGYYGRWPAEVLMRVTDAFLVIPWLPLAMVIARLWGTNYGLIIMIIGFTSWPGTARVVRSDALRVSELQFIERARAIGSSQWHVMKRHVLPNVFPLIFANTILVVAVAILSETTLSFLGLGDPLNFSWGTMLNKSWQSGASADWWWVIPPGIAIVLVVVAFTFVGTAFDEVLDPKLRKREASETVRPGNAEGEPSGKASGATASASGVSFEPLPEDGSSGGSSGNESDDRGGPQ